MDGQMDGRTDGWMDGILPPAVMGWIVSEASLNSQHLEVCLLWWVWTSILVFKTCSCAARVSSSMLTCRPALPSHLLDVVVHFQAFRDPWVWHWVIDFLALNPGSAHLVCCDIEELFCYPGMVFGFSSISTKDPSVCVRYWSMCYWLYLFCNDAWREVK